MGTIGALIGGDKKVREKLEIINPSFKTDVRKLT